MFNIVKAKQVMTSKLELIFYANSVANYEWQDWEGI